MTLSTSLFSMTPDYTPVARMIALQTRLVGQTGEAMLRLSCLPWQSWSAPVTGTAKAPAEKPAVTPADTRVADPAETEVQSVRKSAPEPAAGPAQVAPAAPVVTPAVTLVSPKPVVEKQAQKPAKKTASAKPDVLEAPRGGKADDLTALNGVGPKLEQALNAAGIFHFDQIAAWTGLQTEWVDDQVAGVRGRATRNGWVAQAKALAKK